MKQEPWPARAENPRPSGRGEVNGYTVRERYDRGELPLTAEEERQFGEYDACASDADRAYAGQLRIFGGQKAGVSS